MDAIERAIRSALEKGDGADRTFREKVYRQAFAALERALQANPSVTVETAIKRRKSLQAKITEIEAEFLPNYRSAPATASEPEIVEAPPEEVYIEPAVAPQSVRPEPRAAESRPVQRPEGQRQAGQRIEPGFGHVHGEPIPVAPDIRVEGGATGPIPIVPDIMVETEPELEPVREPAVARPSRVARQERRRPFAAIFTALTVVCIGAIGIWLAYQTGMVGRAPEEPMDIQTPAAEGEDFEPGLEGEPATAGQVDTQREWISVFAPSDPSTVSTPGDASAEATQDSAGPFMRIKSGTSGSAVLFDIGQGVLEKIAGKKATFAIAARSEEDQNTQISVACNLGELGDCGRKRYAVGATRADYLFDLDVPNTKPGAGGTIAINSDFSNSGKAVDIYEIKVSVEE